MISRNGKGNGINKGDGGNTNVGARMQLRVRKV